MVLFYLAFCAQHKVPNLQAILSDEALTECNNNTNIAGASNADCGACWTLIIDLPGMAICARNECSCGQDGIYLYGSNC